MWLNTHLIFACICISSPHSLNAEAACHFHGTWTSALMNCEQSWRGFGSILQSLSHFLAVLDKMFNELTKLTSVCRTFGSWLGCSVLWWALAHLPELWVRAALLSWGTLARTTVNWSCSGRCLWAGHCARCWLGLPGNSLLARLPVCEMPACSLGPFPPCLFSWALIWLSNWCDSKQLD